MQDISRHGVWLYAGGREFLLPFKEYPWFKDAKVSAVYNVKLQHRTHLYWPDLDVDLDLDSLEHPEKYPLIAGRGAIVMEPLRKSAGRRKSHRKRRSRK